MGIAKPFGMIEIVIHKRALNSSGNLLRHRPKLTNPQIRQEMRDWQTAISKI